MTTAIFKAKEAPEVEMKEGERYAGIILGKDGEASYHLILLPGDAGSLTWEEAKEWAGENMGDLPTRREQSLLYANLQEQFQNEWYWSCEESPEEGYAWSQRFSDGIHYHGRTYYHLRARAVRRLPLSWK
jgi:hypothetical protein